mgnify:CR=1 FL=1
MQKGIKLKMLQFQDDVFAHELRLFLALFI